MKPDMQRHTDWYCSDTGSQAAQQEGGQPAHFAAVAVPGSNGHQVQGVPQALAVVPAQE